MGTNLRKQIKISGRPEYPARLKGVAVGWAKNDLGLNNSLQKFFSVEFIQTNLLIHDIEMHFYILDISYIFVAFLVPPGTNMCY